MNHHCRIRSVKTREWGGVFFSLAGVGEFVRTALVDDDPMQFPLATYTRLREWREFHMEQAVRPI